MKRTWRALAALCFGLLAAQWLHAGPFAYITHHDGVSVVDLAFRGVVKELPANAALGVAVHAEVNRAYVADLEKISVVDMDAQQVVATARYSTAGGLITLRPGRPEAYVITDHCSNTPGTACTADLSTVIRIFNTDSNTIAQSFTDNGTQRLAFSSDGLLLFVTRSTDSNLTILNAGTRQVLATVALAGPGRGMAVDAERNLVYVAEPGSGTAAGSVAIVDVAARSVLGRVAVGLEPSDLVLDGDRVYVTNHRSNNVSVISATSRTVVATIPVGQRPLGIDAAPGGRQVVVANQGSDTISIIDTVTFAVTATVHVGPSPAAIGRFIGGSSTALPPDVLTGLWWNPAEPGWGVQVSHRGNHIFAAWFTYNAAGQPKWYVSSDCTLNAQLPSGPGGGEATCTGKIYDTTGPRFFSDPYDPHAVTVNELGLFQMGFTDKDTGAMSFVIGSTVKTMALKRQVFRVDGPSFATDYSDLWWNPAESGWGIGITQQFGTMFLAWFAYDDSGTPMWLVASSCVMNANGDGCSGDLYRTSGPADPLRNAFDPSKVNVAKVGTISASFSDANTGRLDYTVDGKSGTKAITRQFF